MGALFLLPGRACHEAACPMMPQPNIPESSSEQGRLYRFSPVVAPRLRPPPQAGVIGPERGGSGFTKRAFGASADL